MGCFLGGGTDRPRYSIIGLGRCCCCLGIGRTFRRYFLGGEIGGFLFNVSRRRLGLSIL